MRVLKIVGRVVVGVVAFITMPVWGICGLIYELGGIITDFIWEKTGKKNV